MGKLNYDKWAKLEVSDDSDIEGHPNVDHASLVRWKQRDIHEKRDQRKFKIAQYEQELKNNDVLYPKIVEVTKIVSDGGPPAFSSTVERLKTQPSDEAPGPGQMRYDEMLHELMVSIWDECKKEGITAKDDQLGNILTKKLEGHQAKLLARQEHLRSELKAEIAEQEKKITSDDIHEGFSAGSVNKVVEPTPITSSLSKKPQKQQKTTTIETLNAPSASTSKPDEETVADDADDEDEEPDLPKLTPELLGFSKIKRGNFEESYQYIQNHNSVIVEGADDALLVAAFDAETEGKSLYAKNCVNQALSIQYCLKLGKGGSGTPIFYRRMMQGNAQALAVFVKDVEDTYAHLKRRVEATRDEMKASEREQVQLVATDPSMTISFSVPDGPPPAEIELDESLKDMDVEEVRQALQTRWEMFGAFPSDLREALKDNSLDKVNKVLANMEVADAEEIVRLLSTSGIMDVADGGEVRDMTGKNDDADTS